ncbi:hypothetical protein E2F43_10625 [Seongchinamella unica]|uniref:Uncharacterized protein n=1 Tax=Seongchinamella unica TaxID=2547392 RepID=A0A4R5LSP8_9GAMM|nr:hypothetical protein [Seongchinamella unica]TDG13943.1 hypothetical protein E2F43_10625 [Seongchinamella unica]
MNNPIIAITDKVMRMIKSMVYMSMRVSYRRGATTEEVSGFLAEWAPDKSDFYHEGLVERLLAELQQEGRVEQAGARWYPVGIAH